MQESTGQKKPKAKAQTHSTVLIVDANSTRSVTIPTWQLSWIKPIIALLTITTLVFAGLFIWIALKYNHNASETAVLQDEVSELKNATSTEIATKLAELKKSETAIRALQDYLKERNVTVPDVSFESQKTNVNKDKNDAAGGPEIKLSQPIPYIGDFSEQVTNLLDTARIVPFGRPHHGGLSSGFGPRYNPFGTGAGEFHGGLDFRGKTGEPIKVTADGVVDFAGVQRGYGNIVIVKHANNFKTYYAHLSRITVKKGQTVNVGDEVGKLGSTGRSTGPHLHYEVRINNERKNPKPYINFSKS